MDNALSVKRSEARIMTPEQRAEVLAFEAPYVIWKLELTRNVASQQEAHLLFRELKRYLLVCETMHPRLVPTFSRRVDEAWHQFVLFTQEYIDFCERFFGRYLHHRPGYFLDSPQHELMGVEEFAAVYQSLFNEPPPSVWYDAADLHLNDRIRYERVGSRFEARVVDGKAELLYLGGEAPEVITRIDDWGEAALRFIATHEVFYVREIPGIEDADKVELARALLSTWEFCLAF